VIFKDFNFVGTDEFDEVMNVKRKMEVRKMKEK